MHTDSDLRLRHRRNKSGTRIYYYCAQTALPVPIGLSSKNESNTLRFFGVLENKLMIVSLRISNSKSVGLPKK